MVIPQLILPVAGNAPSTQGGAATGGQTAPGGGLFAALLAALAGALEGAANGSTSTASGGGGDGLLLTGDAENAEGAEGAADAVALVDASAVTATPVVTTAKPVPVAASVDAAATPAPVAAPAQAPVAEPATAASSAQPARNAPVVGASVSAETPPAPGPPAPAEAPVTLPAQAATPSPPAAEPALQQAPGLAKAEPPLSTVPADAGKPVETPAEKPEPPRGVPFQSDAKAAASDEPTVTVESKSERPDAPGFEKAKSLVDVLRERDKPITTPVRKAIEAFTKPVAGPSESVANVTRPQPPTVAPLPPVDTANASVADVTRVTAAIAPAEAGSEAPRAGETPAKPEGPVRSTLPEFAQTAVRGIRYLAHNGEHRMSIRLIPESLGEVHIEVHSAKKVLSVKLVAESAMARDAIEAHAHQLRDSLSQEGLEVRTITITDDSGSGRGAQYQREAFASRNGGRGQSQPQQQPAPDPSSGRHASRYAAPRARHEGAFDRVA